MINFTEEQLERYSRHIIFKDIGVEGQIRIMNGKVLIIGAGGLGSPAALYLFAAGVGTIGIVDSDNVELSNLQRQIIHFTKDLNISKVTSAAEKMEALNPDVTILKEYAKEYGVGVPRFEKGNEDCIQCYLCMRVCDEVVGANAVGYRRRGVDREIFTAFAAPSDLCIACGACAWICPTNFMTMETETLERFRTLPGSKRLCRYSLMGIMEGALCANSFRCWKCEVEQRFQDQLQTHPIFLGRSRKMKEIDAYVNQLNEMRG